MQAVGRLGARALRHSHAGRRLRRVREGVRRVAGHPGVLSFAIGNEIPAPIVRRFVIVLTGCITLSFFLRTL